MQGLKEIDEDTFVEYIRGIVSSPDGLIGSYTVPKFFGIVNRVCWAALAIVSEPSVNAFQSYCPPARINNMLHRSNRVRNMHNIQLFCCRVL